MNNKKLITLLVTALITTSLNIPVFAAETVKSSVYDVILTSDNDAPAEEKPYLSISADEAYRMGFIYETDNGEITITGYEGSATSVTVPGEIDGVKVTKIGGPAFHNCTTLESIIFPDTITTIGGWGFYGCSSLKSFDMPDSVTACRNGIFGECTNLESLKISNNLKGCNDIGEGLCYRCKKLKKLYYPKGFELKNGDLFTNTQHFKDCTSLSDIYYSGTYAEWVKVVDEMSYIEDGRGKGTSIFSLELAGLGNANLHFNSTYEDYLADNKAGTDDLNQPQERKTVTMNGIEITYDSIVPFYGKKAIPEAFNIKIMYEGEEYSAVKLKADKKSEKLRITDVTPANKTLKKTLKKLTKGNNGLDINVIPYVVRIKDSESIKIKHKKYGGVETGGYIYIKIMLLNNIYYSCPRSSKKNKAGAYDYDDHVTHYTYCIIHQNGIIGMFKEYEGPTKVSIS